MKINEVYQPIFFEENPLFREKADRTMKTKTPLVPARTQWGYSNIGTSSKNMSITEIQAEQAQNLASMLADNDNKVEEGQDYTTIHRKEQQLERLRSGLKDASFAYGRRNAIRQLVEMRFGGPCTSDDAELVAEMIVPYLVEAAIWHRLPDGTARDPFTETRVFLRSLLPAWTANLEKLTDLVADALAKREAAAALHDPDAGKHIRWLPTMVDLVEALRPTREEARNLRGWSCIDPASTEERREADRLRKRAARAAKGATPRELSLTATRPWQALGISRATFYRRQSKATLASETNASGPYPLDKYGTDETVSALEPMLTTFADNENTPVAAVA